MRALVCLLCCLTSFVLCAAPLAPDAWQGTPEARVRLAGSLDARWAKLFEGERLRPRMQSQEVAGFVLDALATGYDASRVRVALQALDAMFDRDVTSRTYGNLHWYMGDSRLVDRNGIEFAMRKLGLAALLYGDRVDAATRPVLDRILALARVGLTRHEVRISYTNIFLMKSWNLVALGEATGDATLAAQGQSMLRDWVAHTLRTGINEYLSPTYFEVNLDSLSLMANLSRDAETRRLARSALSFVWHDIALHWYAPGGRLGGPHSRDYDRLLSRAALNQKVARTGWLDEAGAGAVAKEADTPYTFFAWTPPPEAARQWLAGPFPRFVSERWGVEAEKRFASWRGRNVAISSVESGYGAGHDNAPMVIHLGGGVDVPILNFFMDGRRDHYGQNKTLEAGSGHMKALHLRPFLTSVQNGPELLFAAAIRHDAATYEALESVITLPADAEYWIDERPVPLFTARSAWKQDYAANGRSTQIDVSEATGSPVLRIVDADTTQGVGVSQVFAAEAGREYRIEAALQGGEIYLYLNFLDAAGRLVDRERNLRVRGGAEAFERREFRALAPPGTVRVKAWLYSVSSLRTEVRVADLRVASSSVGGSERVLGGFDFRAHRAEAVPVAPGATLFVRRDGVAAALRLIDARDVAGRSVAATLHNDGLAHDALRLTVVHADGPRVGRGSFAMWASVTEDARDDAAFGAFRARALRVATQAQLDGERLDVRAAGSVPLRLVSDLARGQRLVREGMRAVPPDAVVWVDGGGEVLLPYIDWLRGY